MGTPLKKGGVTPPSGVISDFCLNKKVAAPSWLSFETSRTQIEP